jgi:signal peptidase II
MTAILNGCTAMRYSPSHDGTTLLPSVSSRRDGPPMTPGTDHRDDGAAEPEGSDGYQASISFLVVVSIISAAADLGSKWWAKAMLSGVDKSKPRHITVLANHCDFIYTLNPGGAWSFLRSLPENLRRPFFLFVSSAAIVFIISVYRRLHPEQWAMRWGLPLALGGAIGNLVDRIRYGSVIDFIDVYLTYKGREMHWPTFNVADIAIVAGVMLMAIDTFAGRRPRVSHTDPPSSSSSSSLSTTPNLPETTSATVIEPAAEASGGVLEAVPKE